MLPTLRPQLQHLSAASGRERSVAPRLSVLAKARRARRRVALSCVRDQAVFALLASTEITYRFVELPGIAAGCRVAARVNTAARGLRRKGASLEPER